MFLLPIGFVCGAIGFVLGRNIKLETYLLFLMKATVLSLIGFVGCLFITMVVFPEDVFNSILKGILVLTISTALPYYVGSLSGALSNIK